MKKNKRDNSFVWFIKSEKVDHFLIGIVKVAILGMLFVGLVNQVGERIPNQETDFCCAIEDANGNTLSLKIGEVKCYEIGGWESYFGCEGDLQ